MTSSAYLQHSFNSRVVRMLFVIASTIVCCSAITAQQLYGPTDNGVTAGFASGRGINIDNVNLYNGQVSVNLPLLNISGRGGLSYSPTVTISRGFVMRPFRYWVPPGQPGTQAPPQLKVISQNYNDSYDYSSFRADLGPGVIIGRKTRDHDPNLSGTIPPSSSDCYTLTKLHLRLPGGEVELRDVLTNGEPHRGFGELYNRQKQWHSVDGSGITFISDSNISDESCSDIDFPAMNGINVIFPTGYLLMNDGTQYRFVNGVATWARDRNGNTMIFGSTTTDSIGRQYQISGGGRFGGSVTYKDHGGVDRTIVVVAGNLSTALRSDFQAAGIQTLAQLFPSISGKFEGPTQTFDPEVTTSVRLPNNTEYRFFYDTYGALARIELPTGGVIEYDYGTVSYAGSSDAPQAFRFISERRIYDSPTHLQTQELYDFTTGKVTTKDSAGTVVSIERHSFKGSPSEDAYSNQTYRPFDNGKELFTEILNPQNPTQVLRRTDYTWRTLDQNGVPTNPPQFTWTHPTNFDCALTAIKLTLGDTNQASQQTFAYDSHGNKTDIYEYDFGAAGTPGPLLRRTHVDYVSDPLYTGVPDFLYTSNSAVHIKNLVSRQWVSADLSGTNKVGQSEFEYDNYTSDQLDPRHAALKPRSSITSLCLRLDNYGSNCLNASDVSYTRRGNVTQVTGYINLPGATTIRSNGQFDIAGNRVKSIDGRGKVTTIEYDDCFGTPDDEATTNFAPSQLGILQTFAFATSIKNAKDQITYNQYNYFLGKLVNMKDPNGIVSSVEYGGGGINGTADLLDRPSRAVKAINTSEKSQTRMVYDDTNRIVTTTSDLNAFDDNLMKKESFYDGLGRNIETHTFETASGYIISKVELGVFGRVTRSYNPYRSTGDETYGYTVNTYDGLSRVIQTESFNSSGSSTGFVTTAYEGNKALVTDEVGNRRVSRSNGVGNLIDVWEIKASDSFTTTVTFGAQTLNGYLTSYEYDASSNLKKVTQGSQPARLFNYDSLNRLKDAANPESGTTLYVYDENGNLTTKTDARGVVTTFVYDDLNRLLTKTHSDGTLGVTYSYDTATLGVGRLASVTTTATTYSNGSYDSSGRVKTSTQLTDGVSYTMSYDYNRAGSLTRQTYPSGRIVNTEYDNAGRISGIKNGGGAYYAGAAPGDANAIQYSAHGAISTMKLGNSNWEHSTYNSRLQTTEIGLGTSSSDSSKLKLSYDYGLLVAGTPDASKNNGNLQRQTITAPGMVRVQDYTYDELGRLFSAIEKNGSTPTWAQFYKYDQFGNRRFDAGTTLPDISQGSANTINPDISGTNNRISGSGYRYDSAGNLECDPLHPCGASAPFTAYYTYDADNRLTTAGGGAGSGGESYVYDGDGKRVKKLSGTVTTVFVYNLNGQLLAEYSDSTPPPTGGTSYITSDNLGSPRAITASNGTISRRDFQPFGEIIGTVGRSGVVGYPAADSLRQQFTGYERDATGLDYAHARYYSSAVGRFTSADIPLMDQNKTNPQSWNLYVYVGNKPLTFTDPFGLWKQIPCSSGRGMCWVSDKKTDTIGSLAKLLGVNAKKLNEHLQNPTVYIGYQVDVSSFFTGAGPVQIYEGRRVYLEVIIWRQSLTLTGVFGHVSYNIDGVSWSWQLGGWEKRRPIGEYIKENDYRDATGFVLDDPNDPDFAANLAELIKSFKGDGDSIIPGFGPYGLIKDNCGEAFCRAVNNTPGLPTNSGVAPVQHKAYIMNKLKPYIKAIITYKRGVATVQQLRP